MQSRLLSQQAGVDHGFLPPGESPGVAYWRPKQVHGALILATRPAGSAREPADGVVSTDPAVAAAVVSADCVALLLATGDGGSVAAVHVGWRGLAGGVVEAGVDAVRRAHPGSPLVAALGPAASGCCYEVGPEVLAAVAAGPARVSPTREGHARLDLRGAVADRLLSLGVSEHSIDVVGPCTICSPAWPSYRREGRVAGRILSYIVPASPSRR